jgi:hypothetical protein
MYLFTDVPSQIKALKEITNTCLRRSDAAYWIDKNGIQFFIQKPAPNIQYSNMVGRAGVEPTTNGLKVRCSTKLS